VSAVSAAAAQGYVVLVLGTACLVVAVVVHCLLLGAKLFASFTAAPCFSRSAAQSFNNLGDTVSLWWRATSSTVQSGLTIFTGKLAVCVAPTTASPKPAFLAAPLLGGSHLVQHGSSVGCVSGSDVAGALAAGVGGASGGSQLSRQGLAQITGVR
jgi:hypothetical protein